MHWTEQRVGAIPWVSWQEGLPYVGARYVARASMWKYGMCVASMKPCTNQERTAHNYLLDALVSLFIHLNVNHRLAKSVLGRPIHKRFARENGGRGPYYLLISTAECFGAILPGSVLVR